MLHYRHLKRGCSCVFLGGSCFTTGLRLMALAIPTALSLPPLSIPQKFREW